VKQKQLAPPELIALSDAWRANLRYRIGENGTDAVLKRSFSALCLEALAERDLSTPFLEETRYRALLDDTLTYLRSEKDLRAFDGRKGWIHATAHTADLLAALALNPSFRRSDQVLVLEAIAEKLASAGAVFTFGEQDRLANAIAKIAGRADFDVDEFRTWLARLNETDDAVWSRSPPRLPLLIRFENDTYMLRALALRMYSGPQISLVKEARTALLDILGRR
jgi:hypothetical protein